MLIDQKSGPESDFPYRDLRREPDPESANLFASDATDRLLMDTAKDAILSAPPGTVVVLGDRYGALTLPVVKLGATGVRVHQDSYSGELALEKNALRLLGAPGTNPEEGFPQYRNLPVSEELFVGARVVLVQLPKSLDQFQAWVQLIAKWAEPDVVLFAGGRVKHMTKAMNSILESCFIDVSASLARQKSRVLTARRIRSDRSIELEKSETNAVEEFYDADLDLWVCSLPGVFSPRRIDLGSRLLVPFVKDISPVQAGGDFTAVDLGCGTGVLAALMARFHPDATVIATDRSSVAVSSTEATLKRNGLDHNCEVRRDHGLLSQPEASVDVIVCNPPFHSDAAVSTELSEMIFQEAARTLEPGGTMLTVFNSHLPHRKVLERVIGPTVQLARNAKFTVTRSTKRG